MGRRRLMQVLSIVAIGATSADAHDIRGAAVQEMSSASRSVLAALQRTPVADFETRSVLNNLRLWTIPRKLSICFLSGDTELRKRVVTSMQSQWPLIELTDGRLDYDATSFQHVPDCGQAVANYSIRVDFAKGQGYWSYVGIESLRHVPSMNFGGFIEAPPPFPEFDRIVGHELGHALGLEHEHQSPAAPDCGWNYDYIWRAYAWNTYDDMKANLERLKDFLATTRHAYIFSSYDKTSQMHYQFEPQAFLNGEKSGCYVSSKNYGPSDIDRSALRIAYGANAVAVQMLSKSAIPNLFSKLPDAQFNELKHLLTLKQELLVK